tara:strand:+ start:3162 stop:3488 length:327 start_codon:yes stop_codon:yes gene_type:complete
MDAKELRIGNYGKEITHSKNGVVKVSKRHFEDIEDGEIDLFPIPLTEEWLVKFGFENAEDDGVIGFNGLYFWDREDGYSLIISGTPVKHVHQLQNLYFALTNEELTIN